MTYIVTETPPVVEVIGVTQAQESGFNRLLKYRGETWNRGEYKYPESVSVYAGSTCYKSHDNKAGRTDEEYLQQAIVDHKHLSVIEHINVSFGVASLPRFVQLELVRHRVGAAYSFMSQRFTDDLMEFVVPPLLRDPSQKDALEHFLVSCESAYENYIETCQRIDNDGIAESGTLRRKRKKEAARAILPNCVGSDGVITYNARQLRHVIELRSDVHADASIREFAYAMYRAAWPIVPWVLNDAVLHDTDFGPPMVKFGAH